MEKFKNILLGYLCLSIVIYYINPRNEMLYDIDKIDKSIQTISFDVPKLSGDNSFEMNQNIEIYSFHSWINSWCLSLLGLPLSLAKFDENYSNNHNYLRSHNLSNNQSYFRRLSNSTSTDSSQSSYSLFGATSHLDPVIGTAAAIIIVFSVLAFDNIFHVLHKLTHDTPFHHMLPAIEKELMIVGCMAFTFRILLSSSVVTDEKWIYSLEYADILVPITSFCFCFEGLLMVGMSLQAFDIWNRAYHLQLVEFLDDYLHSPYVLFLQRYAWLPFSKLNSGLEFRIIHSIFCQQYDISYSTFAFNVYIQKIFEAYLISIISIRYYDWLIVCLIITINFIRITLGWRYSGCVNLENHENCASRNEIAEFTCVGYIIFSLTVLLAIISRYYELKILSTRGVTSGTHYADYLKKLNDERRKSRLKSGLSGMDLKTSLSNAKAKSALEVNSDVSWSIVDSIESFISCLFREGRDRFPSFERNNRISPIDLLRKEINDKTKVFEEEKSNERLSGKMNLLPILQANDNQSSTSNLFSTFTIHSKLPNNKQLSINLDSHFDDHDKDISESNIKTRKSLRKKSSSGRMSGYNKKSKMFIKIDSESNSIAFEQISNHRASIDTPSKKIKLPALVASALQRGITNGALHHAIAKVFENHDDNYSQYRKNLELGFSRELVDIFMFKRPILYFEYVRMIAMVISFYCSLWITNYLFLSHERLNSWSWAIYALLPGVLSLALYIYIAKCAALLKGIVYLNHDAAEETLEQMESTTALGVIMRDKLLSRLKDMGDDPESQLLLLFKDIDGDGSNLLSRKEFQIFLETMGITFSKSRWIQIFHEIDRNFDDQISFEELFLFMFPKHVSANSAEVKRLKSIERRVTMRTEVVNKLNHSPILNTILEVQPNFNFLSSKSKSSKSADRLTPTIYNFELKKNSNSNSFNSPIVQGSISPQGSLSPHALSPTGSSTQRQLSQSALYKDIDISLRNAGRSYEDRNLIINEIDDIENDDENF